MVTRDSPLIPVSLSAWEEGRVPSQEPPTPAAAWLSSQALVAIEALWWVSPSEGLLTAVSSCQCYIPLLLPLPLGKALLSLTALAEPPMWTFSSWLYGIPPLDPSCLQANWGGAVPRHWL